MNKSYNPLIVYSDTTHPLLADSIFFCLAHSIKFMEINRDTLVYGSFAKTKGTFGVRFFNHAFRAARMNRVYLPFAVDDIIYGLTAMDTLGIKGCGVSMPFKATCLRYVTESTLDVERIRAANTLIRDGHSLIAHNTDWLAARELLREKQQSKVYVLGDGGLGRAVRYAAEYIGMAAFVFDRSNWDGLPGLRDGLVFNATPVAAADLGLHESCDLIDCAVGTPTGDRLAYLQACEQFKLYTGKPVPAKTRKLYEAV